VFQLIKPSELKKSFLEWVRSIEKKTQGEIVSIDGKTLCGSRDAKTKAIHMVSAWGNANQLVLGQVKTDEKSNEITAIPTLLDLLELKGCIVTIDAMGCQKDITEKIIEGEAQYVFGLKGNQESLNDDARLYFEDAAKTPRLYDGITNTKTIEKGHGRFENRYYYLSTDIEWLSQRELWRGLNSIGMARSVVEKNGKTTEETRFFIPSLTDVK
jgi:predicted transposase YbfD/YdcC